MDITQKMFKGKMGVSPHGFSAAVYHRLAMDDIERAAMKEAQVPLWLEPPPHLSDAQASQWRNVVVTRGPEWFKPGDLFLLEEYVQACSELKMFRMRCVTSRWKDADEKKDYYRASGLVRRYSQDLSITLSNRVMTAARSRTNRPESALETGARVAAENAMDPLLQGFQMPELEAE